MFNCNDEKDETLNLNLGVGLIKVTFVRFCAKLCYFYFILIGWLKKRGCKRVSERGANSHSHILNSCWAAERALPNSPEGRAQLVNKSSEAHFIERLETACKTVTVWGVCEWRLLSLCPFPICHCVSINLLLVLLATLMESDNSLTCLSIHLVDYKSR